MSAFHGRQYKGAMRDRRQVKRIEAETRNRLTLLDRKSRKPLRKGGAS